MIRKGNTQTGNQVQEMRLILKILHAFSILQYHACKEKVLRVMAGFLSINPTHAEGPFRAPADWIFRQAEEALILNASEPKATVQSPKI